MINMQIRLSSRFQRNYRKLPQKTKNQIKEKIIIFRKDPFDSCLKTHKLVGEETEAWAFWITYSYRIKFIFLDKNQSNVLFLDVGTHDFYK